MQYVFIIFTLTPHLTPPKYTFPPYIPTLYVFSALIQCSMDCIHALHLPVVVEPSAEAWLAYQEQRP